MLSKQQRIDAVAPELRSLVQQHEEGTFKGGVEAFNDYIMNKIADADLVKEEIRNVACAGVHPDNRESSMLVPIDVHDLLRKFAENGFNPNLWDALALTIPHGPKGDEWRRANAALVEDAEGYLAQSESSLLEIVTGRGSHGTHALLCVAFGALGMHPDLCDEHGRISKAALLEKQPSWEAPLKHGLKYKVLPGELELAVPGLLSCLSRIGNASHDVYRQKTALQMCNRIHTIISCRTSKSKDVDIDFVVKQACVGNGGTEYQPQCRQLADFVVAWSGGKDGRWLRDLEKFERTVALKRKLPAAMLQALGTADLLHAPKYIRVASLFVNNHVSAQLATLTHSCVSCALKFACLRLL